MKPLRIEYRQQPEGARGEGEYAHIEPDRFHLMIDGKRVARGTMRECAAALCKRLTVDEALNADAVMVTKDGASGPVRFNKVRARDEAAKALE